MEKTSDKHMYNPHLHQLFFSFQPHFQVEMEIFYATRKKNHLSEKPQNKLGILQAYPIKNNQK